MVMSNGKVIDEPAGPVAQLVRDEFRARINAIMLAKDRLVAELTAELAAGGDPGPAAQAFRRKLLDELNGLRAKVLAAIDPFDRPDIFINEDALEQIARVLERGLDPDG